MLSAILGAAPIPKKQYYKQLIELHSNQTKEGENKKIVQFFKDSDTKVKAIVLLISTVAIVASAGTGAVFGSLAEYSGDTILRATGAALGGAVGGVVGGILIKRKITMQITKTKPYAEWEKKALKEIDSYNLHKYCKR